MRAAREVIAELGVEALSMRDVARRLGISHQAPYRHFDSRDHLLAEIMRRCFVDFADYLDRRVRSASPEEELHAMGMQYIEYARKKPLEYRLMFGTPWPEAAKHPELVNHAVRAFDILRNALRRMHEGTSGSPVRADLDALFIWSSLHGMVGITHANVMQHLVLAPGVAHHFQDDLMEKISAALTGKRSPPRNMPPAKKRTKS